VNVLWFILIGIGSIVFGVSFAILNDYIRYKTSDKERDLKSDISRTLTIGLIGLLAFVVSGILGGILGLF